MIKGPGKTEKEYRAVQMDSSSSLKDFSMDRRKYYKKYILAERVEEEEIKAALIGRIVETLLLEPEEFDNRFFMSSCVTAPTGLMLAFVEALYKHTERNSVEGVLVEEFETIAKAAYVESGFKISFEAVLKKFIDSEAEIYYKEMREVRSKGLSLVTTQDVTNSENIVSELKNNSVTSNIISLIDSDRWKVLNQHQIEGYLVKDHPFKSMMDKIVIDKKEKTIQVYDLKCTWSVERFYEEYYLYRRSYIQAYLYWKAALSMTKDGEYKGYRVLYPQFIVCDSTNYYHPLIYTLDIDDMENAYNGFEHKGRTYPGVNKLIDDLKWAIENDVWNISKTNFINNGMVNIKA